AGIISKRTEFKVGKNQFTFWLKNGSISVEADTQGGTSGLVPPLDRWSYVGAASSSHQTTIYLGADGEVSYEHHKGIVTGTAEGQLPLTIGKLGGNFPGTIAFVWLYAEALPNAAMRDLCAGTLAPADVKGLAFGWTARGLGEVDVVSGSAPNVIGTKLIRLDDLRPKSSPAEPPKQVIASDAKQAVESLDDRKNSKPKRGLRKVISKLFKPK
ncbi:MAG: LamG domain-containing protein, partial [Acidobacteria bacterium]|nr:LamG domain-containing protein [Acidobacteriota bacterium]